MKFPKLSLAIALTALLGSTAFAQTNTPPAGGRPGGRNRAGAEQQLTQLAADLKLTDQQKPKVKVVLEEQVKKMQELRDDTSLSQQDRRAKLMTIREEGNKKMKEILTPEQFKKYEEFQQQQQRNR